MKKFTLWSKKIWLSERQAKMQKDEKPEQARSMIAEKLYITSCCAWNDNLFGMSLVYHHATVVKIVDVATARCCSGLDQSGSLIKVDFFPINDVAQLSLLIFVPGVVGYKALFLSMAS